MVEPTAADLRAVAVAKLKRAASLPRMKDGRRPPMHDDAVSEGDRSNNAESGAVSQADEVTDEVLSKPDNNNAPQSSSSSQRQQQQPLSSKDDEEDDNEDDDLGLVGDENATVSASGRDTPSKTKRRGRSRSRSRSRSRGSKDFKEAIAKANESFRPSDSSPDEQLPPIPFFAPTLASPIPSHFTTLPIHPRAFFPPPSPHHYLHTPTSPPPTLEALRAGLIRSNSARALAMHKLTGRDSPTNPFAPSPSPTPLSGPSVGRSNTVTGAERSAARNLMLKRLEKRAPIKDSGGESDLTSGNEEYMPGLDSSSSGRQSKRGSPALSNAVIDDRDPVHTAPASPTPIATTFPHPDVQNEGYSYPLFNGVNEDHFEFDGRIRRGIQPTAAVHGIVIEEDNEDDGADATIRLPAEPNRLPVNGMPSTPARMPSIRLPSASASSVSTSTDVAGERVPLYLHEQGKESPYVTDTFDTFPVTISPMGTPVRESDIREDDMGDGDDKVVFQYPEELRERKAFLTRAENNLSWIGADDGNLSKQDGYKLILMISFY